MTIAAFKESLANELPPTNLKMVLQSLWYDAKGNWSKAHDLINDRTDPVSAHVHAYLHRKEGDAGNARYWYTRAGKTPSTKKPEAEWEELLLAYL